MEPIRQRRVNSKCANPTKSKEEELHSSSSSGGDHNSRAITLNSMTRKRVRSILLRLLIWGLVMVYLVVPLALRYSSALQRNIVFLSFVRWPIFIDLTKPGELGLPATCNFFLKSTNVTLGVWHILPLYLQNDHEKVAIEDCGRSFISHDPVILYLHGNSGTRGGSHRIELYQVLRKLNYHVITFDYRGYADSSNISPSEEGVIEDATFVYKWVRQRVKHAPLILWGHSLGTGVATATVKSLCRDNDPPSGLILESPFNNLRDEIRNHPFTTPYRIIPFFDEFILGAIERNIQFASDKSITSINIPILILHAEDDHVVPFSLGKKLYEAAVKSRSSNHPKVFFTKFAARHSYGHRYICRAPELAQIISDFVNKCQ